jgi:hypothetical protein
MRIPAISAGCSDLISATHSGQIGHPYVMI